MQWEGGRLAGAVLGVEAGGNEQRCGVLSYIGGVPDTWVVDCVFAGTDGGGSLRTAHCGSDLPGAPILRRSGDFGCAVGGEVDFDAARGDGPDQQRHDHKGVDNLEGGLVVVGEIRVDEQGNAER